MENKSFNIKSVSWHKVSDKIDEGIISKILNDNITLTSYGSGLKKIYFKYICTKPSNEIHENEADFTDRELNISLNLSYKHVLESDNKTVTEMISRLFLVSIDLYDNLDIPDFDIQKFREDVQQLFKNEELIH